jgi:hypothetical protein
MRDGKCLSYYDYSSFFYFVKRKTRWPNFIAFYCKPRYDSVVKRSPRVGSIKTYKPVPFDRFYEHTAWIPEGMKLRVIQPYGCPKNGTMGMCYVEELNGDFVGLVCINSLE